MSDSTSNPPCVDAQTLQAGNKSVVTEGSKSEVVISVPDEALPGPESGHGGRRASRYKVEFADDPNSRADIEIPTKEHDGGRRHSNGHPPPYTPYHHVEGYDQLGNLTLEALPHADHYRDLVSTANAMRKRPTLLELHELDIAEEAIEAAEGEKIHEVLEKPADIHSIQPLPVEQLKPEKPPAKFGWIIGVFVRCLLNIFGVMLFLRITWVVGQAGLGYATLIILLACTVTLLTGLSMSAISTNGEVKGGGAYYMISRSLGPEFGGAIGIVFALANALAVAMYVIGFAETIRDILRDYDIVIVDDINDVRIIGFITVILLLGIALAGLDWEARAQLVLLVILLAAIANVMIGTFLPPSDSDKEMGFTGYSTKHFTENFVPDFREGYSFFTVFAVFFPAATGILAGANISGDLKDAQKAIPKGTLLAILVTTIVYLVIAWMAGLCMDRDAFGPMDIFVNNITDFTTTSTLLDTTGSAVVDVSTKSPEMVCHPGQCKYGLQNNMRVTQLISIYSPITIAGIISATLSSALASLISAPKVFQAVCKDKIFPYISVFGKGYGRGGEPRRAYLLTFAIGMACICIGDLNTVAPLISNFFLMSYGLICYCCVDASLAKSPGWRPAFKYYNAFLSLLGAILCVVVMFIMNWWTALITIGIVAILYLYVHYRKPEINWGDSTQAHVYKNALQHTQKLSLVHEHIKNFRPQLLVLTALPSDRPALVDFCGSISKHISLMICGHVLLPDDAASQYSLFGGMPNSESSMLRRPSSVQIDLKLARRYSTGSVLHQSRLSNAQMLGDNDTEMKDVRHVTQVAYDWLTKRRVKSFYNVVSASSLRLGVQTMMQAVGLGKLKPNVLILGFKSNWHTSSHEDVEDYFNIIHDAFDVNYGVGIMRIKEGLDYSQLSQPLFESKSTASLSSKLSNPSKLLSWRRGSNIKSTNTPVASSQESNLPGSCNPGFYIGSTPDTVEETQRNTGMRSSVGSATDIGYGGMDGPRSSVSPEQFQNIYRFHRKKQRGNVDVWWLFDDGGLTLLIPYLLTTKKLWSSCKLRIFMASSKESAFDLEQEHKHMATLLKKFRIEYSSITLVADIGKEPEIGSLNTFDNIVSDWTINKSQGESEDSHPWKVTDYELSSQRERTLRHVRLRELLQQYSSEATLVVVTLPMPRKGMCSAGLYMAWIDTLTRDMPPILLLRGNQESVLTYYS